MAEQRPVSPGHFDRFNFCNTAGHWELKITHLKMNGVTYADSPNPIVVNPGTIHPVDVCQDVSILATRLEITAVAVDLDNPGQEMHYNHTYFAPINPQHYINNVAFGIVERCALGNPPEAVFFGEAEVSEDSSGAFTTKWHLMPEAPH